MELLSLETQSEYLDMMSRIGKVFPSELGFENAKKYIKGLLSPIERKNGWQIAEAVGDLTPYAMQQFIYRGRFRANDIRDETRNYVIDKLGDEDGVLVTDDTGFIKKGKMSCGVKRQYSGTAGKVENCQIGVFLTYASSKGHAPVDRRLYIPQDWFDDAARCQKAGIPKTVTFETKPKMALEMIKEATQANVPYRWVCGDCAYGNYKAIRQWLEEQRKCYVLCVSGDEHIQLENKKASLSSVLKTLDDNRWFEASCGDGSKGLRLYDWQVLELDVPPIEGWKRCLLVRKSKTDPEDIRAHICFAPVNTPTQKLVQIAGIRWTVETCFEESKADVGLDQYEVQSYDGWYKHISFACLALALLTALSCNSLDKMTFQQHSPSSSSLVEFKKGRGLHA